MGTSSTERTRQQRAREAAARAAATPETDYLRAVIAWANAQRGAGKYASAGGRVAIMAAELLTEIEGMASPKGTTAMALSKALGIPLRGKGESDLTRRTALETLNAASVDLASGHVSLPSIRGGLHAARVLSRRKVVADEAAVSTRMAMVLSGANAGGQPPTLDTPCRCSGTQAERARGLPRQHLWRDHAHFPVDLLVDPDSSGSGVDDDAGPVR